MWGFFFVPLTKKPKDMARGTRGTIKAKIKAAEEALGRPLTNIRRAYNRRIRAGGKDSSMQDIVKRIEKLLRPTAAPQQIKATDWEPTFCEQDYVSGDGFQTSVWGPCTWVTLHLFSLNYTPARKRGYQLLIDGLKETLPCVHCRNNFQKNWQSALKAMRQRGVRDVWANRETFSRMIWQLHHCVNVMLGKDLTNEPSYEKMRDDYETFRSRCLTPEEIAEAQRKAKESGCVDSPYFNKYGAPSKARTHIWFGPRDDSAPARVSGINISPDCRVCKK